MPKGAYVLLYNECANFLIKQPRMARKLYCNNRQNSIKVLLKQLQIARKIVFQSEIKSDGT